MSDTVITASEPAWAAFIGLDWGSKKHAWILQPAGGGKPERGFVDNTPEAIAVWAADLNRRFAGQPVAVALEQSRGSVVNQLPKTIPVTPVGFWTCCCGTATVFVVSNLMSLTLAYCCCWSKTVANWWTIRPAWRCACKIA